jgi:hypothetical protein
VSEPHRIALLRLLFRAEQRAEKARVSFFLALFFLSLLLASTPFEKAFLVLVLLFFASRIESLWTL